MHNFKWVSVSKRGHGSHHICLPQSRIDELSHEGWKIRESDINESQADVLKAAFDCRDVDFRKYCDFMKQKVGVSGVAEELKFKLLNEIDNIIKAKENMAKLIDDYMPD